MSTSVRFRVVLALPRSTRKLLEFAHHVAAGIGSYHVIFGGPVPPLAELIAAIDELEVAERATRSRTVGTVQVRDMSKNALVSLLRQCHHYVQGLVDQEPDRALVIAKSAGMRIFAPGMRRLVPLQVKAGTHSGTIDLRAWIGKERRVANEWQYSVDQRTWLSAPASLKARTTIANLQPGARTWFRHRVITKEGPGEWSQLVSTVVQ